MFKKNSWIALLLALSLTAFFVGCVDPLPDGENDDDITYIEVPLDKGFNAWAGQTYQKGWAVAGIHFSGVGDKAEIAKDVGYLNEDFVKARYLVIEMPDETYPKGNYNIVWGGEGEDGTDAGFGGWNQSADITPGEYREGNILKIDLTKALKNYPVYKTAVKVRLIIQYNQTGGVEGLVNSAKLLIPDIVEPFVPVTNIALAKTAGFMNKDFPLNGAVAPEDASKQSIVWSIIGFLPAGAEDVAANWLTVTGNAGTAAYNTSKTALLNKVDFKATTRIITPAVTYTDYSVLPPEEIVVGPAVTTAWKSGNIIIATAEGKARVRATILEGDEDEDDYTQDFVITFTDPVPFKINVGGVTQQTQEWGGGATDGNSTDMVVETGGDKLTVDFSAGYGNCYYYVKVNFGGEGGETLGSYDGVKFKYWGVDGDFNYKTVRVMAMDVPPTPENLAALYNPGVKVGESGSTSGVTVGTPVQLSAAFNDDSADLASANEVYFWFIPWSGPVKFSISDVELYKSPVTIKVNNVDQIVTEYYGLHNPGGNATGAYMKANEDGNGFIATYEGAGYGNGYSYFKVDFGSDKFSNYTGIRFTYKGVGGDYNFKPAIRVKAMTTVPPANSYAPGDFVAWTGETGDVSTTGKQLDAKLGWNYSVNPPDQASNINTANVNNASVVYFWIYVNSNPVSFEISNIEFYK